MWHFSLLQKRPLAKCGALAAYKPVAFAHLQSGRGARAAHYLQQFASLARCAMGKRQLAHSPSVAPSPQKRSRSSVPSVSTFTALSAGASSLSQDGSSCSVQMRIKKYCNNGSVYSDCFTGSALYTIQVASNAAPSPLFQMKHQLSTYLSTQKQEAMAAGDSMATALPPLPYEEWCNSDHVAYQ